MTPPLADVPPVHHVFVDFENVHQLDFSIMEKRPVHLTLLIGAKQSRMAVETVQHLLQYPDNVHLIRLTSSGKDALDFALAYYVGRAAVLDPGGWFHIVSKDTGFDPLVEHLRSRHLKVRRHPGFSALLTAISPASTRPPNSPPAKAATAASPVAKPSPVSPETSPALTESDVSKALGHFVKNPSSRPGKKTTLLNHLRSHMGKPATEKDALRLMASLEALGHLSITEKGKVEYHLPAAPSAGGGPTLDPDAPASATPAPADPPEEIAPLADLPMPADPPATEDNTVVPFALI
jgi:hypothetical protein